MKEIKMLVYWSFPATRKVKRFPIQRNKINIKPTSLTGLFRFKFGGRDFILRKIHFVNGWPTAETPACICFEYCGITEQYIFSHGPYSFKDHGKVIYYNKETLVDETIEDEDGDTVEILHPIVDELVTEKVLFVKVHTCKRAANVVRAANVLNIPGVSKKIVIFNCKIKLK